MSLPRFSHHVYGSSEIFCAFSTLLCAPRSCPLLPSLRSRRSRGATVSLGRRVLRLWLLVARWRRHSSRIFRPTTLTTWKISMISLSSTFTSIIIVRVPAPVLAHISAFVLVPVLVLVPVPAPVSVPVTVSSFSSLVPCVPPQYDMGRKAPGLAPDAAGYLQAASSV